MLWLLWAVPLFILCFAILAELMISNYIIDAESFAVHISGLPEEFDKFVIAQISDLHMTSFGGKNNARFFEVLEAIGPDIFAVTGDLVSGKKDIRFLPELAERIAAIAPVYYVHGNHELYTDRLNEIDRILTDAGWHLLSNSCETIQRAGEKLAILGLEDVTDRSKTWADPVEPDNIDQIISSAKAKSQALVTLCHRNDRFEGLSGQALPLLLTGHAHGGIIRLPGTDGLLGTNRKFFPKYTNGVYKKDSTLMIASRGLGRGPLTIRLFNRPHLPVISLRSARRPGA